MFEAGNLLFFKPFIFRNFRLLISSFQGGKTPDERRSSIRFKRFESALFVRLRGAFRPNVRTITFFAPTRQECFLTFRRRNSLCATGAAFR